MTHTIQPFGENALLITLPSDIRPSYVEAAVVQHFAVNARVGLNTVLITGNALPAIEDLNTVIGTVPASSVTAGAKRIDIPVVYDGEDLDLVAQNLSLTTRALIDLHLNTTWHVALVGFAPGFPYLVPEDPASPFANVPRLASPRAQVPAGSVAVAAGMSAVYPTAMPGGWMLLGHTDSTLFNPANPKPSLLTAGDIVKFIEVRP